MALTSVLVSAGLAAGKLAAGLATGSLAPLSEAADGLADVGVTAITFWAVRLSDRPTRTTLTATARSRAAPRS